MKINVEFLGLPSLTKAIGAKRVELDLNNGTLGNVLDSLVTKFGRHVKEALFDRENKLDISIQVLLNGKEWLSRDRRDINLNEGDALTFMMLVAGG